MIREGEGGEEFVCLGNLIAGTPIPEPNSNE